MRYISEIESPDNVRILVMQDLKELGIKVPKTKSKNKTKEESAAMSNCCVFGNYLTLVPCMLVDECGPVPKFLVQATHILDKHMDIEGLFRKSGSVARQKELKIKIEANEDLMEANPLDVAGLIKQFFRELPDPLFTSRLHDTFLKCYSLDSEDARVTAILLLCHQLPWRHLSTLRYMTLFLQKVAHNCDLNKMDIANLAVCVTPNFMHNNNNLSKSDKMNMTESKWLQIQTSIVQMLILYAGDIGMVPDSLYERSVLMSTCFPTDDELEKSEAVHEDVSTNRTNNKKKKKRSGSLQGLVNNLSSSFTKWRKDNKGHNASSISDRSTMSYLSFDKSSMVSDPADLTHMTLPPGIGDEFLNPDMFIEATPKMIRKRKAEDEAVPFSASKKKAILQHMPQMATLGSTPFTPLARRSRYPGEFQETPNIKFVDADNMVFNGGSTPCLVTPKRKMDKMFSPYSTTKVKRQSSGKSGCFSPKTSKGNMRKSVRGFFRRLSGGKEPPASPSSQLDIGSRLAGVPDSLLIMDPGAGNRKKTFFKRHRKTPSSPARLVTHMAAELQREKIAMASRGSSASNVKHSDHELDGSFSNTELVSRLGSDLQLESPGDNDKTPVIGGKMHRSNLSLDSTATSLRRGKPNTVKTGLPLEYSKRRSLDIDSFPPGDDKEIDSIANTLDTSPILKEHQGSLFRDSPREIDVDTAATPISDDAHLIRQSSTSSIMSRQLSKTSLTSINPLDSGLDQAFINESVLADMTHVGEACDKSPLNETDVVDTEVDMDARYSVKYSCVEVTVDPSDVGIHSDNTNSKINNKVDLLSQNSIDSLDSAVGSEVSPADMYKSTSLHSLQSCDSGLSIQGGNGDIHQKLNIKSDSSLVSARLKQQANSHNQKINMRASCDLNKMINVSSESAPKMMNESILDLQSAAKVSSTLPQFDNDKEEIEKRRESPHRFCNSPIRRVPNSPVRIPTIFARADQEAVHYREIARVALGGTTRTASIRRPKLPISTNLVRCDSVQRCKKSLRMPEYDVHTPDGSAPPTGSAGHTPARTNQRHGMKVIEFNSPGLTSQSMNDTMHRHTLCDSNVVNTSVLDVIPSTPRIKPQLLASDKSNLLLSKSATLAVTVDTGRYRTPVKPVKRLQNSPHSPHSRRLSRSPRRLSTSPRKPGGTRRGMSPLPNQDPDWNI